jgi:diguanylate cyclase (GGDEF)-like protein/PAS domain S-box-containing protein
LDIQTKNEFTMKKTDKSTKSATPQAITLQRNAEKIAREKADWSPKKQEALSPEETLRILHELQVHQIELEMQNDELRRTQTELDGSRARYFDLYDLAPVGYVTVSEQGLILEANLTAATLLGVSRGTLVKLLLTRFILKEDQAIYYLHRKQLLDTGEPQMCELRMVKKDGTAFWAHLAATVAKDKGGVTVYRVVMSDITAHKQAEEALHESEQRYLELSIIDDLTQLYNSRHFYTQLENEIERSNRYEQPLTLLMMDLDNFKTFNDAYGHVEGDYVLSRLGQVIKRCLRETDSAYRYGGEEFTIMLPMTTSEEGIVTAKRIQTELRKEAFSPVLGQEVYLTISIGLAQYKPKEEMKAFVQRVDQLMYKGKKNGRGKICCNDEDLQ